MTPSAIVRVEIGAQDEIILEVRCGAQGRAGPVRLHRYDLLTALICTEGASMSIPCRQQVKDDQDGA